MGSKKVTEYNPLNLAKKFKNNEIAYNDLTQNQKTAVVRFLREEQAMTYREMAEFLGCADKTVYNQIQKMREEDAIRLREEGVSVFEAAARLRSTVGWVQKRARENNDPALYLKAELEYQDALQSLGILYKEPEEVKHSGEFEFSTVEEYKVLIEIVDEAIQLQSASSDSEDRETKALPKDEVH